jgi:hypothetical protein
MARVGVGTGSGSSEARPKDEKVSTLRRTIRAGGRNPRLDESRPDAELAGTRGIERYRDCRYQVKRSLLCDTSRVMPDTRPRQQQSQPFVNDRTVVVSPPRFPDA